MQDVPLLGIREHREMVSGEFFVGAGEGRGKGSGFEGNLRDLRQQK